MTKSSKPVDTVKHHSPMFPVHRNDGYVSFSSTGITVDLNRFLASEEGKHVVRQASKDSKSK